MKWILAISLLISGGLVWLLFQHLENLENNPQNIPSYIPVGDRLLLNHGYREGNHIFSGEIKLPNSCYGISTRVVQNNIPTPTATIFLTSVDERLKYTICSQISAGIPFDLMIEAPENLVVRLFVDGKERMYTLNNVPWNDQVKSSIAPLKTVK